MKNTTVLVNTILIIIVLFVSFTAYTQEYDDENDFRVRTFGGSAVITGYTGTKQVINIPPQIQGMSVTGIGDRAFYYNQNITAVTIPDSVRNIGDYAFSNCVNLRSVTLGNNVNRIGNWAFEECINLTVITIPDSVNNIGSSAFRSCHRLIEINVSPGNRYYSSNDGVLYDKEQKTLIQFPGGTRGTFTIPDGVTTIGHGAFHFSGISGVIIPDSVTSINNWAFARSGLIEIIIPNSISFIDEAVFLGCGRLTSVTLPDTITVIKRGVFTDCRSLNSVIIPDSVTSIEESAFLGSGIISVNILASVSSIGERVFSSCSRLTAINVSHGNRYYSSTDGVLYDKEQRVLIQFPGGRAGVFTIPDGVITIGENSFSHSRNITGVIISDSVITIGQRAFYYCDNIISVIIGNSVTSIERNAFWVCKSLESITIPASVTSIAYNAFIVNDSLTSVTFESSTVNFISPVIFPGDLIAKYSDTANGGAGTYTRPAGGRVWIKQTKQ